ncbi:MAG: hypothetical protein AB1776_01335 [Bacillota bacterium]
MPQPEQQQASMPALALLFLLGAMSAATPDFEARLDFISNLVQNIRDVSSGIRESIERLQSLAVPRPAQEGPEPQEEE